MIDEAILKNSLWESTIEAFKTMVMLPISKSETPAQIDQSVSFSGSITFMGPLEGALLLQSDIESIKKITRSMLEMEDSEAVGDPDAKDTLGEIINLVLGGFKSRMAPKIGDIDISVPTVVVGSSVRPTCGKGTKIIALSAGGADYKIKLSIVYKEAA
ncbi:MAG: chemotaxis protein CheX [Planctomycetes bacterium]|nr:chemotaxis protein CheX [Planctomycetota bacterium]